MVLYETLFLDRVFYEKPFTAFAHSPTNQPSSRLLSPLSCKERHFKRPAQGRRRGGASGASAGATNLSETTLFSYLPLSETANAEYKKQCNIHFFVSKSI
jgi:hypothetical protein